MPRTGGKPGIFLIFDYFLSQLQCLSPPRCWVFIKSSSVRCGQWFWRKLGSFVSALLSLNRSAFDHSATAIPCWLVFMFVLFKDSSWQLAAGHRLHPWSYSFVWGGQGETIKVWIESKSSYWPWWGATKRVRTKKSYSKNCDITKQVLMLSVVSRP